MRVELVPGGSGSHAYEQLLVRLAPERFSGLQVALHLLPFGIGRRLLMKTRPPVEASCWVRHDEDGRFSAPWRRAVGHARLGEKVALACPGCGHVLRVAR